MARPLVRIDLHKLNRLRAELHNQLRAGSPGHLSTVLNKHWPDTCVKDEEGIFETNSHSGGPWPDLSPRTAAKPTKPKRKGIMWVTSALRNALRRGAKGNLVQRIRNGVRVGFGGTATHPGT